MNFLTQIDNLALLALMLITGAALFLPTLSTLIGGRGLSPSEATIWINRRKAVVLDLRPESDFKIGHLPGSKHILADRISTGIDKLKIDRQNPVILVCHSGMSARKVVPELKKLGFAEVAVLDGGVQGWQAASLPLVK